MGVLEGGGLPLIMDVGSVSNDGIRGNCPERSRLFLLIESRSFRADNRTRSATGDSFDGKLELLVGVLQRMDAVFDILSSSSVDILQLSTLSVASTSTATALSVNMALLSNASSKPISASEDNE